MPAKNDDLHGNVPDSSDVALLLIDVINDFEFEGAEAIFGYALPVAQRIAALKQRTRRAGIPTIYINDNFGKWQSNFHTLIEHCLKEDVRGRPIVRLLKPAEDDYFVLKPKQSGFYSTTLDVLLKHLEARTLIIAGFAGNICVLFTAQDAYMRDFHLFVPADCTASNRVEENAYALEHINHVLRANISPSTELDLDKIKKECIQ